ncbi:MAG TPA: formate hydrogenlyase [Deltaproteobacteria bacterium]|jgi:hydrogenase-4 component E|nr:formate hydrogenlyase [Deltaproteobacteria bacterium]
MTGLPFDLQLLNLCAALLLLVSFAMLTQRRIVNLVNLLAFQGTLLLVATLLLAWRTGQRHLYLSAVLTLALKVTFLPWMLHRLIRRLEVYWDTEPLLNISGTMLVGLLVVVFAFGLAQPISALASTATRSSIGIAIAVVLLSFITMITRRKAMSQVVGFLSMENGLFFGAMSATYGMPMIVEFGVALDVLVAVIVLGIFFFQIREQFDSLDLHHLESLKEGATVAQADSIVEDS